MTTKKFIIKNIIKIFIFIVISTIIMTLIQSPIITNEIALGQMENSNEMFLIIETYNKVRPLIEIVYGCIALLFVGKIIYDTYKFIKTKITKDKGE